MYDFLIRPRNEFEHLCAHVLARHPCVSLMDALVEGRNEDTHLQKAGLLWNSSVLVARSSVARPVAPVPHASPSVASSAAHGASTSLHCDHYGQYGHVETFCYRKKKLRRLRLANPHRVLVVLVLEDLRGVMLVQRHKSCCYYFSVFHFGATFCPFSRYLSFAS
jgi:hypothetical protein